MIPETSSGQACAKADVRCIKKIRDISVKTSQHTGRSKDLRYLIGQPLDLNILNSIIFLYSTQT